MRVVLYYDLLRFSPCSIDLFIYEHFSPPHTRNRIIVCFSYAFCIAPSYPRLTAQQGFLPSHTEVDCAALRVSVSASAWILHKQAARGTQAFKQAFCTSPFVCISSMGDLALWFFASLPLCLFGYRVCVPYQTVVTVVTIVSCVRALEIDQVISCSNSIGIWPLLARALYPGRGCCGCGCCVGFCLAAFLYINSVGRGDE